MVQTPASARRIHWRKDKMKKFINKLKKFMKSEDGPTAVEYAIMLALIVIVCLAAIQNIGSQISSSPSN